MSRLQQVHIESYRAIRDLRLQQFGRMNLLVGANNAGKTSVLEAIGLLARPLDPGQWVQTATNRDASGPVVDALWAIFPSASALNLEGGQQSSEPILIRATLDEERRLRACATAFTEAWADLERPGAEAQTDSVIRIRVDVEEGATKKAGHEMEFRSTPRRIALGHGLTHLRAFVVTPSTHRSTQQLVAHLSHVIDLGQKEKCVQLLRIFDDAVEDVEISRPLNRDTIRVKLKGNVIVDLATFGDGMRRAFAMSIALIRAGGGILLIDEIESAIHARALGRVLPWLVRAAEEADVQVVATTHSLEAVDAVLTVFDGEKPDTVVTYHLRRSDAAHVCHRYELPELRALREEGLDIR